MWVVLLLAVSLHVLVPGVRAETCEQGKNCLLPNCYCPGERIPLDMKPRDVPQMVVVALDGNLDRQRDKHYEQLLQKHLRNPNGCQVSATMFVPGKNTDMDLVRKWYGRGHEVAVNSQLGVPTYNFWYSIKRPEMKDQVLKPLTSFTKEAKVPRSDIIGYRSPAFFTPGNIQFQVLEYEDFKYDASLRANRRSVFDVKFWPATLDFKWELRCVVGRCPTNKYPGFWVVPSVPYFNGTEADRFSANLFAYASAFNGRSQRETFDFLWHNFEQFYQNGRAPFILNINTVGFIGEGGEERIKGFQQFLNKIMETPNVYIVSMRQLIDWMEDPTPIDKIQTFSSWSCAASEAGSKAEERDRGTPVRVTDLQRQSKLDLLYGRSDALSLTVSVFLCFLVSVAHVLFCR